METLYNIAQVASSSFTRRINEPFYYILIFDGSATFSVNFTEYTCSGKTFIFLSPYQSFEWRHSEAILIDVLTFHGDFYCIEYHKKEVACNGILFNNIYQQPYVSVSKDVFNEVNSIVVKMKSYNSFQNSFDHSILKTYLQLILALSSKEKQKQLNQPVDDEHNLAVIVDFQTALEASFLEFKDVSYYAGKLNLSVSAFSKKIKNHFGKSPSKLIQERVVLEAKKLLHLTHTSIKEIAARLNFNDEFYFSRYFKKETGVSPKQFREKTGISIVAKQSM